MPFCKQQYEKLASKVHAAHTVLLLTGFNKSFWSLSIEEYEKNNSGNLLQQKQVSMHFLLIKCCYFICFTALTSSLCHCWVIYIQWNTAIVIHFYARMKSRQKKYDPETKVQRQEVVVFHKRPISKEVIKSWFTPKAAQRTKILHPLSSPWRHLFPHPKLFPASWSPNKSHLQLPVFSLVHVFWTWLNGKLINMSNICCISPHSDVNHNLFSFRQENKLFIHPGEQN